MIEHVDGGVRLVHDPKAVKGFDVAFAIFGSLISAGGMYFAISPLLGKPLSSEVLAVALLGFGGYLLRNTFQGGRKRVFVEATEGELRLRRRDEVLKSLDRSSVARIEYLAMSGSGGTRNTFRMTMYDRNDLRVAVWDLVKLRTGFEPAAMREFFEASGIAGVTLPDRSGQNTWLGGGPARMPFRPPGEHKAP